MRTDYEFLKQICPEPTYKVLQRINLRLESADQMPSPDVMVIEYQAWSKAQKDGYPRTTPFLVVEVISPSNRKRSITAKVQRYLESGVPTVWVVHPKKRIVNVYDGNKTAVLSEADILRVPPTLAIGAFSVRQLFSFAEKITSL